MSDRPSCIVLRPLGRKMGADGTAIDFDQVYVQVVRPAIEAAGMEPVARDLEAYDLVSELRSALETAPVAVVDVTFNNPFVLYELGLRDATRPDATLLLACEGTPLMPAFSHRTLLVYPRPNPRMLEAQAHVTRAALTSALVQLLARPQRVKALPHDRAEGFHRVERDLRLKEEMAAARAEKSPARLRALREELRARQTVEPGVLLDLYLSFRALSMHADMVALYDSLPAPQQRDVMVREQLAFALNRLKQRERAQAILEAVIKETGPNPESMGLLARIHKDRWQEAAAGGDPVAAHTHLDDAIAAYRSGFLSDWRDAYPGVNLVTLLELRARPGDREEQAGYLPVVRFAAAQRLRGTPDYWDHATLVELAVLANDEADARRHLAAAVATAPHEWQRETTCAQLQKIRDARRARAEASPWLDALVEELGGGTRA